MALPTISHNSPIAGSIAWTGFGIQYNGVSYSIPPGNTSQKFVWWLYNGGAPALQSGNALPALGPDDMILFLNKTGIGALVPTADMLDGSLIVGGSILAPAIGANQINTNHLVANVITTTELSANAVYADNIAAGQITTDKLGVGTVGDSLVANSSFEEFANGLPIGWKAGILVNGSIDIVTGVASSGTNAARLVCAGTNSDVRLVQAPEKYIPVSSTAGRYWYLGMRAGAGTASTKGLHLRASWYDVNKAWISNTDAVTNSAIGTSFDIYEGQVTPPSSARYMCVSALMAAPSVATNVYVDELVAREVVISAQIGDGAITSPKIIANAINATHIAAGTISADKLTIARGANLFNDAEMEDLPSWNTSAANFSAGTGYLGNGSYLISASPSQVGAYYGVANKSVRVRVVAGGTYRIGAWVRTDASAAVDSLTVYARAYNSATGAYVFATDVGPTARNKAIVPANVWTFVEGMVKIPAGYDGIVLGLYKQTTFTGAARWSDPTVQQAMAGELIVDGSIKTEHMTANTIHGNVILVNTISSNLIATNAITSNHVGANVITTVQLSANSVTSNEISGNAITAKHIGAGSILANKLVVGNATNAMPDPSFMNDDITTKRLTRSSGGTAGWTVGAPAASGIPSVSRVTGSTNDNFHYSTYTPDTGMAGNAIQVTAGQKWLLEVDVETSVSAGVRWNYFKYMADGTESYLSLSSFNVGTGKRKLSYLLTIPAGMVAMELALACNVSACTWTVYGNAVVAMQSPSTLIEDGAITTINIAANAVTSTKIIANAITANHISANAITATEINANAITGTKIAANALDAKVITGSTVQTAATGARLVLNTTGLTGWDANNVNYLTANSSGLSVTGTLTAEGTGYVGTTPTPVEVVIGGSTARVSNGLTTEQLPPWPPAGNGGNPVPGIAFKPTSTTMYDYAQITAVDGVRLKIQSGRTQADVTANADSYRTTALTFPDDGIYSNKPLFAKYSAAHTSSKRVPLGVLAVVKKTTSTTVNSTETQFATSTITVIPGSTLEISGLFTGYPTSDNVFMSWYWKANGAAFCENAHKADTNGNTQGGVFSALYVVPSGQTSVTISVTGQVFIGSGYICPADASAPKLQYAIKDIGSI